MVLLEEVIIAHMANKAKTIYRQLPVLPLQEVERSKNEIEKEERQIAKVREEAREMQEQNTNLKTTVIFSDKVERFS